MIRKHPRHDTNTPAGQIVNDIKTIGDYVEKVMQQEFPKKKLTFEEWWKNKPEIYGDKPFEYMVDAAEAAWNASKENV